MPASYVFAFMFQCLTGIQARYNTERSNCMVPMRGFNAVPAYTYIATEIRRIGHSKNRPSFNYVMVLLSKRPHLVRAERLYRLRQLGCEFLQDVAIVVYDPEENGVLAGESVI